MHDENHDLFFCSRIDGVGKFTASYVLLTFFNQMLWLRLTNVDFVTARVLFSR